MSLSKQKGRWAVVDCTSIFYPVVTRFSSLSRARKYRNLLLMSLNKSYKYAPIVIERWKHKYTKFL